MGSFINATITGLISIGVWVGIILFFYIIMQ